MGDELFRALLSANNIGTNLKKFIGYDPTKPRTLGGEKIESRYKIVLERCGISLEDFIRDDQAQVLESKRLEKEGTKEEKEESAKKIKKWENMLIKNIWQLFLRLF